MAQVSWLLCCEDFVVKENGLCDAKDLLFELHTPQLPIMGSVNITIAALFRTDDPETEETLEIRIAVILPDGSLQPSSATWKVEFPSQQVLWYKKLTELFLQEYGFTFIALQALENDEWITKAEYPILILA